MGGLVWCNQDFEPDTFEFLKRFVCPGMNILEAGAHQGYFTVLLSKLVGGTGKVWAFEPSPRERKRLSHNLRTNRRSNVLIDSRALGRRSSSDTFYVCDFQTGCNSLRTPNVDDFTSRIDVDVVDLDTALTNSEVESIDLIKLDAEGAELDILHGASSAISRLRPVIHCEMVDSRTCAWGYPAVSIYCHMIELNYEWFSFSSSHQLKPCPAKGAFHENLIAVPAEKVSTVSETLSNNDNFEEQYRLPPG